MSDCESANRKIVDRLGVGIEDFGGFNCCGYPYKGVDFKAFILMSGRNLALAEKKGADLVTTCACCYGTIKQADNILKQDASLFDYVNGVLRREGLAYSGNGVVKHLIEVLLDNPGIPGLKAKLDGSLLGVKVATQYGCKMLRPSDVVSFDSPLSPSKFDELIEATGAEAVSWTQKLECCGAPLIGVNDATAMQLAKNKFDSAREAKADLMVTACPFCYLQFGRSRDALSLEPGADYIVPSVTIVQLLGLALGLGEDTLGIKGANLPARLMRYTHSREVPLSA
jgi:heterodisulfide reductase subunit B